MLLLSTRKALFPPSINPTPASQNGVWRKASSPRSSKLSNNANHVLALKQFDIPKISQSPTTPLPFLHVLTRLKTTPREGWRRFGIENGESISDHMYRMAIITMLAPPSLAKRLNLAHCAKMALVHDMAECLVGDITPVDNVAKNEKSRREATTMDFLTSKLLGSSAGATGLKEAGEGIKEIWQEYEDSKTPEAIFVHDVDKFELVLQMVEYEKAQRRKTDLGEFMYVANKVQTPEVRKWCVAILKERMELWGDEYEDLKEGVQEGRQLLEKYRAEGGEEFPEL